MSDQDRISPYNINTISLSKQVMRIKKILIRGLLIDPIPILQTNITRTIWQTVKRITNEILVVERLTPWNDEHVQLLQTISTH